MRKLRTPNTPLIPCRTAIITLDLMADSTPRSSFLKLLLFLNFSFASLASLLIFSVLPVFSNFSKAESILLSTI